MHVRTVRATVKPDSASEAEAATRGMFAALNEMRPVGVQYASCKLADGITFVAVLALNDPATNPLPALTEWVAFRERLEGWRAAPPAVDQLTVVGSYGCFSVLDSRTLQRLRHVS